MKRKICIIILISMIVLNISACSNRNYNGDFYYKTLFINQYNNYDNFPNKEMIVEKYKMINEDGNVKSPKLFIKIDNKENQLSVCEDFNFEKNLVDKISEIRTSFFKKKSLLLLIYSGDMGTGGYVDSVIKTGNNLEINVKFPEGTFFNESNSYCYILLEVEKEQISDVSQFNVIETR